MSSSDPSHRSYLSEITTGQEWYNARIQIRGGQALFCPPGRLPITQDLQSDILQRYLRQGRPEEWNQPLGMVMLKALQHVFPCP
jgi:hypothetical protein